MIEDRLPFLIMTVRNIILLSYDTLLMISIFSYALRSEREGFTLRCLHCKLTCLLNNYNVVNLEDGCYLAQKQRGLSSSLRNST